MPIYKGRRQNRAQIDGWKWWGGQGEPMKHHSGEGYGNTAQQSQSHRWSASQFAQNPRFAHKQHKWSCFMRLHTEKTLMVPINTDQREVLWKAAVE